MEKKLFEVGYAFREGGNKLGLLVKKETDKAVQVIVAHGGSYATEVWLPKSQVEIRIDKPETEVIGGRQVVIMNKWVVAVRQWLLKEKLSHYVGNSIYAKEKGADKMVCEFSFKGMTDSFYRWCGNYYGSMGLHTCEQIDYFKKTGEKISSERAEELYGTWNHHPVEMFAKAF